MLRICTVVLFSILTTLGFSQGVTTCQLSGYIKGSSGEIITNALVTLENAGTNTAVSVFSQDNGKYNFQNIKAGEEYKLEVSHLGKETVIVEDFALRLGEIYVRNITLNTSPVELESVDIVADQTQRLSEKSGGHSTHLSREELEMFPSINRSLLDYIQLNPHAGTQGFLGRGSRDNFISIDGSGFNNVYGIGGPTASLIGNVVGAEPFGIDAIEEVQMVLSPFDVSEGGFTGASISAVTRSGSNEYTGSLYSYYGQDALVGNKIDGQDQPLSSFSSWRLGASLSGPLIRNKLFFFINYEQNDRTAPATNFLAQRPGLAGDNVTRVAASDLDEISDFLQDNYGYQTGPYEAYDLKTENRKILAKIDWVLNERNRLTLRYNYLDASMEGNTTNSGSFGSGNRVDNLFSMSYQNSGQLRKVKVHSFIGELLSTLSKRFVNRLAVSYASFPDSRQIKGKSFPSVDILSQGRTYLSFGSHLFASKNRIDQSVFQLSDELSAIYGNHTVSLGMNMELYGFQYDFTPAFAGSFIFNSLEDFYNSTPIGSLTPIGLSNGIGRPSTYARRYSTLEAGSQTSVEPSFSRISLYLMDELLLNDLRLTGGIRLDYNLFGGNPLSNSAVSSLTFQNENGVDEQFMTDRLPGSSVAISPRIGFHWNLPAIDQLSLRGGAGIFTGLPSMVRIGDQFINNGVLQGEIKARNNQANQYPFSPDPDAYIPESLNLPNTYDLNFVVADYRPPSLFRTNLGFDYMVSEDWKLSFDITYSKDINRDHVRNANMDHSPAGTASDNRFVFSNNRLNGPAVLGAYVLDNSSLGNQLFFSWQVKKEFNEGWFGSLSYTLGKSEDLNSFGASTTRTSFRNLAVSGNANDPAISFSDYDQRHRIVAFLGKKMKIFKFGKTAISLFLEGAQQGRFSYTYASNGDVNKDGVPSNDLIYIPESQADIALEAYNASGQMISVQDQWEVLDKFITSSDYLSQNRGTIAKRNGSILPWYVQGNFRLMQNISFLGHKNNIELSFDIFNFPNLISSSWGIRKLPAETRPIQARPNGKFRVSPSLQNNEYITDTGLLSRWQMQFGLKYRFEQDE